MVGTAPWTVITRTDPDQPGGREEWTYFAPDDDDDPEDFARVVWGADPGEVTQILQAKHEALGQTQRVIAGRSGTDLRVGLGGMS